MGGTVEQDLAAYMAGLEEQDAKEAFFADNYEEVYQDVFAEETACTGEGEKIDDKAVDSEVQRRLKEMWERRNEI